MRAQGYISESDQTLSNTAFGIRFAYRMCVTIIVVAMATQSVALFWVMLGIAFLGVVLPNHPFDYVYNFLLSGLMNRPKVPARSRQLKFACTIATLCLAAVVYLLASGFTTPAMVLAGMLAAMAAIPSTIDFCVPSVIYNALFQKNVNKTEVTVS